MGTKAKTYSAIKGKRRCYRRSFKNADSEREYKEKQAFYTGKTWRRLRAEKINANPLCETCEKAGRTEPAVDVDHILPRDEYPHLELDWTNLQSLCKRHHGLKTRREESSPGGGGSKL